MRVASWILGGLAAFGLGLPVQAATLELRNLAAEVTVIPENRGDIAVTVVRTDPHRPLYVRAGPGGSTLVEGDRRGRGWPPFLGWINSCPGSTVRVFGAPRVPSEHLPQLVVRTPRSLTIQSSGAVSGVVGRSDALDLTIVGCDRWTVANVKDDLRLRTEGSGKVQAGGAGQADAEIVGSGSISLGAVANGLSARINGSGDITATAASGPVAAKIGGSGHILIDGGHASDLRTEIGGSGEIRYGGRADGLDADIGGSGTIVIAGVDGPVRQSIGGSGKVKIGP